MFKDNFVWGAATAAFQVEGGASEDGKGDSIWDVYCRRPGNVVENDTGDEACDHYHRFREDVKLMAQLGIKAYRFSISWPRVLPEGTGAVNEKGMAFYENLVDELLQYGIGPYVTLYHWDLPYALHLRGGWLNPDSVKWFAEYAALMAKRFGSRVKNYFTFNEPQIFVGLGYLTGSHAPGLKLARDETILIAHHVMQAHGEAVRAMRAAAPCPIRIGYAPTGSFAYPFRETEEDIRAAYDSTFGIYPDAENYLFNVSWWCDPVFFGTYPEEGLAAFGQYLPKGWEKDLESMHPKMDFCGQNIYNGHCVRAGQDGRIIEVERERGYNRTAMNWPVTPQALGWGARLLYQKYGLPIVITENGMACHDVISLDGKVHDPNRIDFLTRYLRTLDEAIDQGTDVAAYFAWSLMDNMEWPSGYSRRFGLVYVDYPTQKRIIKDSGYWYRRVIETNGRSLYEES